jgi:RNA polymerase sigma-70 factor, ECF subfamily
MATGDDALLDRAKRGDRQALVAIYDAYYPALYRYIYRQVDGEESARDLTADVFQRFLEALHKGIGPDQQLKAWLYRVAHNAVIDYYRRQQYRDHLPLLEQVINTHDDPVRLVEAHLTAVHLHQILRQLTPEQQQIIALKFFAGLNNEEIALVVGRSVGAVKARQHRAIAALQRHLLPTEEEAI